MVCTQSVGVFVWFLIKAMADFVWHVYILNVTSVWFQAHEIHGSAHSRHNK